MGEISLIWISGLVLCVGLAAFSTPVMAADKDRPFNAAVRLYQEGRYSAAFGKFVELANAGDADAAHIALFMNRFGPTLYGSWWDADPQDMARWVAAMPDGHGRPQPAFLPIPYSHPARTVAAPATARRAPATGSSRSARVEP